jgi:hypothetical protein
LRLAKSSDAYVVATLEALVADPDAFPPNMSPKVGVTTSSDVVVVDPAEHRSGAR